MDKVIINGRMMSFYQNASDQFVLPIIQSILICQYFFYGGRRVDDVGSERKKRGNDEKSWKALKVKHSWITLCLLEVSLHPSLFFTPFFSNLCNFFKPKSSLKSF